MNVLIVARDPLSDEMANLVVHMTLPPGDDYELTIALRGQNYCSHVMETKPSYVIDMTRDMKWLATFRTFALNRGPNPWRMEIITLQGDPVKYAKDLVVARLKPRKCTKERQKDSTDTK